MDIPRELTDQFVRITNAEETLANQLLLDNQLNFEAAVASFFAIQEAREGAAPSGAPLASAAMPSHAGNANQMEMDAELAAALAESEGDNVRAPIPQRVDTLLPGQALRRNQAVVDPFTEPSGERENRLSELFRPPSRLVYSGALEEAFELGNTTKRWVLVTIHQSDIFACQVLTRDVWNDADVQELLETYFVFWHRDNASDDGARYRQFYPFSNPPHIAVLDPRSGERVVTLNAPEVSFTRDNVLRYLTEFATANSLESGDQVRRPPPVHSRHSGAPAASSAPPADPSSSAPAVEDLVDTEEAQLAAAIAASMESLPLGSAAGVSSVPIPLDDDDDDDGTPPNGLAGTGQGSAALSRAVSRQLSASNAMLNRDRSLRAQQDLEFRASLELDRAKEESARAEEARAQRVREIRDAKRQRIPPEPPAGAPNVAELVVRLPSNARLKRRFLVTHTIGDVYDFVESEADEAANGEFDLMTPFPRKTFADRSLQIGDAGLSPKALLVVHVR